MYSSKLTYSIGEMAGLLESEPEVIRDALVAAGVRMMHGGADADLSGWPARRVQQQPDGSILLLDISLVPSPDEVDVLGDNLPETLQTRLRSARMTQMLAEQATPEYQRDVADVDAAFKLLDDAEVNLALMEEALGNAPKTGDVTSVQKAQADVRKAQKRVDWAQAALDRMHGDECSSDKELDLLPLEPSAESHSRTQVCGHHEAHGTIPCVDSGADETDDREWVPKVRKMAIEIIARDKAKDLYPSQVDIADEIARKLRDHGYVGPNGKPLAGSYIKRHGLDGISSAIHKRRSTSIKRGK